MSKKERRVQWFLAEKRGLDFRHRVQCAPAKFLRYRTNAAGTIALCTNLHRSEIQFIEANTTSIVIRARMYEIDATREYQSSEDGAKLLDILYSIYLARCLAQGETPQW